MLVWNMYYCPSLVHLKGQSNILLFSLSIESSDFLLRDTPVWLSGGFSEVRLDASNDAVTLEIGDTVILRLDPTAANIVGLVEQIGQFLRDTATVTILDNDCKQPLQSVEYCFVKTDWYSSCKLPSTCFSGTGQLIIIFIVSPETNSLIWDKSGPFNICVVLFVCVCSHLRRNDLILVCKQRGQRIYRSQCYCVSDGSALTDSCWISECTC